MKSKGHHSEPEQQLIVRPDLKLVSEMMVEAWARPCREYSEDLLRSYIDRPTNDPQLSVAIAMGQRIMGYTNYTVYDFWCKREPMKAAVVRFAASRKESAGKFVGGKLSNKLWETIQNHGYDGLLGVTESDSTASRFFERVYKKILSTVNSRVYKLKVFPILMGMPRMIRRRTQDSGECEVHPYSPHWRAQCVQLVEELKDKVNLARRIPPADADFIFSERPLTRSWLFVDGGKVRALLNVIRVKVLGIVKDSINVYIEHVFFGDLQEDERRNFIGTVFRDSYWDDVEAVYNADSGYYDASSFLASGFYRTPKTCNLYWGPINDKFGFQEVDSFYLDVF